MPRLLCSPCFYDRDRHVPATNFEAIREYGSTPRCDDCAESAAELQAEADFAAFHGGSSWGDSGQMERAREVGAWRR